MPETKLFAFPEYENYSTMPNIFDRILGQSRAHNAIYTNFKALSVHFCFIGEKKDTLNQRKKKWRRGSDIVKDEKAGNKLNACKSTFFPLKYSKSIS